MTLIIHRIHIEKGLDYREYTLAMFFDIEGAFNNIRIEGIGETLEWKAAHLFLKE